MQWFSELGPFFTVAVHRPPPGPPWRPVFELPASAALSERIAEVQAALSSDRRVASSVAQLSVAARLLAPALALAVRDRRPVSLLDWYWQPPVAATFALSVPADPRPGSPLTGPVTALAAGLPGLPARVGWGNVASAINTAAVLLGPAAHPMAGQLLAGVPGEPTAVGPAFRRNSCCLLYRAGRPYCGDCVLTGPRPT